MISNALKHSVDDLGLHHQGLSSKDVSSHSLRAGGAMAMFLNGISDTTIKKIGRWSSDTFLTYIHAQIAKFAKDVSKRMATPVNFHNIAYTPTAFNSMSKTPKLVTSY